MKTGESNPTRQAPRSRSGFGEDFRRFFLRGLATLLPTLITLWLLFWAWDFLWRSLGRHIIYSIIWLWSKLVDWQIMPFQARNYMSWYWRRNLPEWKVQLIGVGLAILLVYIVGLLVGNLIGRTMWVLAERAVLRIPLVRAIYPAVKQVTDFLLAERKQQFEANRVVAVQPHARGIWSIGLVTGAGLKPLSLATGQEMVTVFIPSSPTAFSGYVVVVPRDSLIELPLKVDEAMRLLVSGGVISPDARAAAVSAAAPHGELGQQPSIIDQRLARE